MQVGIMVTNGGPHSPEKWAVMTAGQIIQVASTASGIQAIDGRKLELRIIDILEKHHNEVQKNERAALKAKGGKRLETDLSKEVQLYIQPIVDEIVEAAADTMFADHFKKELVLKNLYQTIGQHLTTNMHIERSWHADKHPDDPQSKAYKARFNPQT